MAETEHTERTEHLAMFPLGSVLFPHLPLRLRIFEERYLVMLAAILDSDAPEFGVTLIERGQEVGGGEHRFAVGTVAQVTEIEAREGYIAVVAQGERRLEVAEWLDDDPYPQATVHVLPELEWHDDLAPLRLEAEKSVRRALAIASEFTEQAWASVVELSDDPLSSSWQMAGIAPLGQLDQIELLRSSTLEELLLAVIRMSTEAAESFPLMFTDGTSPDDPSPEDPPSDDPPSEDPPSEDPPSEDPPSEDPPSEDPPSEDPPSDDPPSEDPPSDDPPSEDPPSDDPPSDDSAFDH